MKLSTEKILKKIEELDNSETIDFIPFLDLTLEQMDILSNHEDKYVRRGLADNIKITEKIMIKLAGDKYGEVRWRLPYNPKITKMVVIQLASDCDWSVNNIAFEKLQFLNSLKKEELEEAYDLIMKSKHISREHFAETFDYIAKKFPELSELAKMFKRIILKGKKDLK